uniref:Uncharacterized protein n=1 Tax=Oikopleura dioica TaxID=34765 RepID=Q676D9_OIKDI|nr:hypothetical protein KIAA0562-like protein [Oikopleura dioica]
MIPQKVVLFIGDFQQNSAKNVWRKIGFFTFLENPLEDQRELKTINLSQHVAIGQYVKMEIYEPYNKKSNLFNKSPVGEEIRQYEAEVLADRYLRKYGIEEEKENMRGAGDSNSIKLDAETDLLITRMGEEKAIAEHKEDFDMASALKNIIATTLVVGEQIYQCDMGKVLKVKQEQYEEAKGFKIRRDELKLKRDRAIDEELHQFGFSVNYFLKRVGSSQSTVSPLTPLDEILSQNTENEYMKMNSHKSREEPQKQESIETVGQQLSLPVESSYAESAFSEFESDNQNQPIPQQQIDIKNKDTEAKRNGRPPTPEDAFDFDLKEKTKSINKFDVLIFGEEFCLKAIEKAFQPRLDTATDLQRFVERDPIELLESKDLTEAFARFDEGIRHRDAQVRGKACELLYLLYSQNGVMARNMFEILVKGDGVEVKNDLPQKIVDQIYDEFDKLDGKPTKKQLEAERKKQEAVRKRAEQAEIEELQKQIAAARQANRNQEMRSGAQSQAASNYAAPSVNNEEIFDDDDEDENSKQCIFCLEINDKFIEQQDEKDGMDMHYWKECPMLTKCKECKMVIEISGYNEHLVRECPSKANYAECKKCNAAFEKTLIQKHEKNCSGNKAEKAKCSLCELAVTDSEEGWREHLMASKGGCKKNDRRQGTVLEFQCLTIYHY